MANVVIQKHIDNKGLTQPVTTPGWGEHTCYSNPWVTWTRTSLIDTLLSLPDWWKQKAPSATEAESIVVYPDWDQLKKPPRDGGLQVTWLGHSTCLVQLDGYTILTDPVLSPQCTYAWAEYKRLTRVPITVKQLPAVHAVLVSHNHGDHLDLDTVQQLRERFGQSLMWLVPDGLEQWIRKQGFDNVQEMCWWDEYAITQDTEDETNKADDGETGNVTVCENEASSERNMQTAKDKAQDNVKDNIKRADNRTDNSNCHGNIFAGKPERVKLTFVCLPAQHFSKASSFNTNVTLWCGWAVLGSKSRFYFAGDTGYCPEFKVIGEKYGPFTAAAIPIGACCPRTLMKNVCVNPEDALEIHRDVRAELSIGIHWGTFALGTEDFLYPMKEVQKYGEGFITLKQGEVKRLSNDSKPEDISTRVLQSSGTEMVTTETQVDEPNAEHSKTQKPIKKEPKQVPKVLEPDAENRDHQEHKDEKPSTETKVDESNSENSETLEHREEESSTETKVDESNSESSETLEHREEESSTETKVHEPNAESSETLEHREEKSSTETKVHEPGAESSETLEHREEESSTETKVHEPNAESSETLEHREEKSSTETKVHEPGAESSETLEHREEESSTETKVHEPGAESSETLEHREEESSTESKVHEPGAESSETLEHREEESSTETKIHEPGAESSETLEHREEESSTETKVHEPGAENSETLEHREEESSTETNVDEPNADMK